MNTRILSARIFVLVLVVASILTSSARAAEAAKSGSGIKAIYPAPGETVEKTRPLITADLTGLATPADKNTIVVFFDGADVTGSADVTVSYVMYRPPDDLYGGAHKIKIKGKDASGAVIPPFEWTFHIKAFEPGYVPSDNTRGKLTMSTDFSQVFYEENKDYKVSDILQEKEGAKFNMNFDMSNVSGGRTVIATFHRETQMYTDIEIDKGNVRYFDSKFEAAAGHFRVKLSDLTISGVELGGVKIDKPVGNWKFSLFSGRSQDPSTSGTFKQITSGLRTQYSWDSRNTTSLTWLIAQETDNEFFRQVALPGEDRIAGVMHEYKYDERFSATLEGAANTREEYGKTGVDDEAVKLGIKAKVGFVNAELDAYDLGENFVPVGDGNSKYLLNNRRGVRGRGVATPADWITAGGEYEQYDSWDAGVSREKTTKRGNAFVALSNSYRQRVQYTKSKLVTTRGVVSETDSMTASMFTPRAGVFKNGRASVSVQDSQYTDGKIYTDSYMVVVAGGIWFRDILGISSSLTLGDVKVAPLGTATENSKFSIGLDWNIMPGVLTLKTQYENLDSDGTGVDNHETRFRNNLRYVTSESYAWLLGFDRIVYDNKITPEFDYQQNILRSGLEVSF